MLTFDVGSHSVAINKILQILKDKSAPATFFIYGAKMINYPDLLQLISNNGNEISNHGWGQVAFTKQTLSHLELMLRQTEQIIRNHTVAGTVLSNFVRPPFGITNDLINAHILKTMGRKVVLWSLDSKDHILKTAKEVCDQVVENAKPGDIVLFQDFPLTIQSLPSIIDKLNEKGYEFLTLSTVASFPDGSPH